MSFFLSDDWMQRYEYMIELGKSLPLINPEFKTALNNIKGWPQGMGSLD